LIQDGEKDEANPWLKRTGWVPYLKGLDPEALQASIERPNSNPEKEEEPVAEVIWTAMAEVARVSQLSVMHEIGVFVRLEAIRTEKHQTRYQPLEPYMNKESIQDRVRPWQEILMFLLRTQQPHEWKSPRYRFTRRQRSAWERLITEAVRIVRGGPEEEDEEETDDDEVGGRIRVRSD
jgi:hypothetical protein